MTKRSPRNSSDFSSIERLESRQMLTIDPFTLQDGTVIDSSDDVGREIGNLSTTVSDIRQQAILSGIPLDASFDAMVLDAEQKVDSLATFGQDALSTDATADSIRLALPGLRQAFTDASTAVTTAESALDTAQREYQQLLGNDPLATGYLGAVSEEQQAKTDDDQARADIDRYNAGLVFWQNTVDESSRASEDAANAFMDALNHLNEPGGQERYTAASQDYVTKNIAYRDVTRTLDQTSISLRGALAHKTDTARILQNKEDALQSWTQRDAAGIAARTAKQQEIDGLAQTLDAKKRDKATASDTVTNAERALDAAENTLSVIFADPRFNQILHDIDGATHVLQQAIDDKITAAEQAEADRLAHIQQLYDDISNLEHDIDETNAAIIAPSESTQSIDDLIAQRNILLDTLHTDHEELKGLDTTFSDDGVEQQESLTLLSTLVGNLQQFMAQRGDIFSELQPQPALERQKNADLNTLQHRIDDLTRERNDRQSIVDDLQQRIDDIDADIDYLTAHPESANGGYHPDWMTPGSAVAIVEGTAGKKTWAMNISPDGRFLGRGDTTGQMELIDARTGAILWQGLDNGYICDISFNTDGSKMAALHSNGVITIIDSQTYATSSQSVVNDYYFGNMRWMGDEIYVSMQGVGLIRIVNATTGQYRSIIPTSGTNGIAIAGDTIFTGGSYGNMSLYRTDGTLLAEAPSPGNVCTVAATDDGNFFAAITYDGTVSLYDASLHLIGTDKSVNKGYRLSFLTGNKGLVAYDPDGHLVVYDLAQQTLGTPTIISTNAAQGYSNSMGIAPDNSLVFNIDPNNGIRATALPESLWINPFERTMNDLQNRRSSVQFLLDTATNNLNDTLQRLSPLLLQHSDLQFDRDTIHGNIASLEAELQTLDGQIDAIEKLMRAESIRNAEIANGGPLSDVQMQQILSQVSDTLATGEITIPDDILFGIAQELHDEFFTLRSWIDGLTIRKSFLEEILPTASADDAALLEQQISALDDLLQQTTTHLTNVRTAWTLIGGTVSADDIPVASSTDIPVKMSPELQRILYSLPLALPDLQSAIGALLGQTTVHSTLAATDAVTFENNNFAHLPFSLSLLGGSGMLRAITNYGTAPTMTQTDNGIQILNGSAVLDFADILTRVTRVTGTVQGINSQEAVLITAYRGPHELSTVTMGPDGHFSIEDMEGITCVIIHSASKTLSLGAIDVQGDLQSQQMTVDAVSGLNNDLFSRLTAQNLHFGDLNAFRDRISLTYIHDGPFRGHSNSTLGFYFQADPNQYTLLSLVGTNPHFDGLNYINSDGQGVAYPSNRYEVIGNIIIIYPTGFSNQKDLFLWADGFSNFSTTLGSDREGSLPPISAPPTATMVAKRVLNDYTTSWGDAFTEGSSRGIVDSFEGIYNINNYSLTDFRVDSISVHIGPTGTIADPVTASLNEPRSFGPGMAASFHVPIIMQGFSYDQNYTIFAHMADGTDVELSSGRFQGSRPSDGPVDNRHLVHLAILGETVANNQHNVADANFYASVINEFVITGTLSASTAYAFTSTPSYTLLAERDNIMATTGENLRAALIAYYLSQGMDSSFAAQSADFKMQSIIKNPQLFAGQFGVTGFDQTNTSFERLLSGGITFIAAAMNQGAFVAGYEMGEVIVDDSMLEDLHAAAGINTNDVIFSKLTYTIVSGDTLSGIAAKYHIPYLRILNLPENDFLLDDRHENGSMIFPGEKIVVPLSGLLADNADGNQPLSPFTIKQTLLSLSRPVADGTVYILSNSLSGEGATLPAFQNPQWVKVSNANEGALSQYLYDSAKQVVLGNYTDQVTLLGTGGQIALGLFELDAAADIRDLTEDVQNWQWSWGHGLQTTADLIGFLPVVGVIKNADEVTILVKRYAKEGDKIVESGIDVIKGVNRRVNGVLQIVTEEAIKSHILDLHINKTDQELLSRLTAEGTRASSAFTDQTIAADVLNAIQDTFGSQIDIWLKDPLAKSTKEFDIDFGTAIGRGILKGQTSLSDVASWNVGRIVFTKDASGTIHLLTGYPIPYIGFH